MTNRIVTVASGTVARDAVLGVSASVQHNYIRASLLARAVNIEDHLASTDEDDDWNYEAITEAAAAAAEDGAYLFTPARPDPFLTKKITLPDGIGGVLGVPGKSVWKLGNARNTALVTSEDFTTTDATGGLYDALIEGMVFDGNAANQSSNADEATLQIQGYLYELSRVAVRNAKTKGIYSNWSSSSDPPGPDNRGMQCFWDKVEVTGFGTKGVDFVGPHDSVLSRVFVHALTGSGLTGIRLGPRAYGTKLAWSHAYGNGLDYPLDIEGTSALSLLAGVQVEHGQWEGGQLAQIRSKWTRGLDLRGNKVYAAGTISVPVGLLLDASDQCLSVGNRFENLTSGTYKFASDVGGHTLVDKIYQNSGALVDGTPGSSTKIEPLDVHGATTAAPGSAVTVASGVLTFPYGATFIYANGEGSASDTVTNVLPTGRTGQRITFLANHELTFSNAAGGDGQVLTPDGASFVVPQFRVVTMILVESSPDTWVIEAVA